MSAHNLNKEIPLAGAACARLLQHRIKVKRDTRRTTFLIASPRLLACAPQICHVLLHCVRKGTLQSITLDEAHLFAKWGATFRPEIHTLGDVLSCPLFDRTLTPRRPFLVATTATCSLKPPAPLELITRLLDAYGCLLSVVYLDVHAWWPSQQFWIYQSIQ